MRLLSYFCCFVFFLISVSRAQTPGTPPYTTLQSNFVSPPLDCRPWVYWFWLNGNITKEGITSDLEAMKRVGIGGVLIMEVDQGAPPGPVAFASPAWRELFKFSAQEANRLGMSINMSNDAGWCGSGGPWITPALSMQKVVWSEIQVTGPRHMVQSLPDPERNEDYYEDLLVQAYPTPLSDLRIPDLRGKSALDRQEFPPLSASYPDTPTTQKIDTSRINNLTAQFENGQLTWDVPAGNWTIVRYGHTSTGVENHPAPAGGLGLESDKLSQKATEAMFNGLIGKLVSDLGPLAGSALVSTHIDSWETGSQNWTSGFSSEFRRLRGYDPEPYWPVLTGRVVCSPEISERFLWDWRKTVSDLLVNNYAGAMADLAHQHGLRLSIEGYDAPCNEIAYAGRCDEPMGEFWSWDWGQAAYSCTEMVSAAHVYGKRIIGAESFTATDHERWRSYPGSLKPLGDWAFCEGINRFVVHRYAMQPWLVDRKPGMSMGPWGVHYEKTETWWEQSKPWHEYLSRCQFLLRQGLPVADICYLEPEGAIQFHSPVPSTDNPPDRPGYNYDGCNSDVVLNRMEVKDGRLVLPDGMNYQLLVLPQSDTMTPTLLHKVDQLIQAGATVLGSRPLKYPSLQGYTAADKDVEELAKKIWGTKDDSNIGHHAWGAGEVIWNSTASQVLANRGIPQDFNASPELREQLRYTHRRMDDGTDIYFIANKRPYAVEGTVSFRVQGKSPEWWWPETGKTEEATRYQEQNGMTQLPLYLEGTESVFVVFRPQLVAQDSVVSITRNGEPVKPQLPGVSPQLIITQASYGIPGDSTRSRDVTGKLQSMIKMGQFSFPISSLAEGDDPAFGIVKTLRVNFIVGGHANVLSGQDPETMDLLSSEKITKDSDKPRVVITEASYGIPHDPSRTRDVRNKLQSMVDQEQFDFTVARLADGDDPALGTVKTLVVKYTVDGRSQTFSVQDPEPIDLGVAFMLSRTAEIHSINSQLWLEAWKDGLYEIKTATGRQADCNVSAIPEPRLIAGPWRLTFPKQFGTPEKIVLPELVSWSEHPDSGVQHFSGTATYHNTFQITSLAPSIKVMLDLGRVDVVAEVKVNGQDLGILWKAPYRTEITSALHSGVNDLEIRVTNLWINRLIGDEQLPEDSERNGDGTLKYWPQWLVDGLPSPTGRITFTDWRLWHKDDPLQKSGLLGPVSLYFSVRVPIFTGR